MPMGIVDVLYLRNIDSEQMNMQAGDLAEPLGTPRDVPS
jgi:hypothetical protein